MDRNRRDWALQRLQKATGSSALSDSGILSEYRKEREAMTAYLNARGWVPSIRQVSDVMAEPRFAPFINLLASDPKADGTKVLELAAWIATAREAKQRAISALSTRFPRVSAIVARQDAIREQDSARKREEWSHFLAIKQVPAPVPLERKLPSCDDPTSRWLMRWHRERIR